MAFIPRPHIHIPAHLPQRHDILPRQHPVEGLQLLVQRVNDQLLRQDKAAGAEWQVSVDTKN